MIKAPLSYPIYLYKEGTNVESYKTFKPSYVTNEGKKVWRFRCYAPNAKSVSIIGDFNNWDRKKHPMTDIGEGVFQVFVGQLKKFDSYKFSVEGADGIIRDKADPYALHAETAPGKASKVYDIQGYEWHDELYIDNRKAKNFITSPLNVYEIHAGSFKRGENNSVMGYRELADELIPYILEMHYTHIELLPITEYPFEGSWGYQISGLYAPTSRYGTPHDFMYFVDKCHKNNIGVILDFVVSHFPKDEFGLYNFDGTTLYEYTDPFKREHKSWGTVVFDYSKGFVRSFLTSAVCFWAENYHIDGFRMDAVASMLYLDYDRKDGEWQPNLKGGKENLEAIQFLQQLNSAVLSKYPGVMMIAEESTAFPMVTMPPSVGGLGFNFKWNMGWMNDTLTYASIDPFFRKGSHNKLTFSLTYAFSENYILPFSHDEVVHGKGSLISKMPCEYKNKFDELKTIFAYQMTHPGKKLNFMGNEFAQFIEWDFQKGIDFLLLEYDTHRNIHNYVKDLNRYYITHPELFELDNELQGFKWIVVDDNIQNIIAFFRQSKNGDKTIVIINFSEVPRANYIIGVPDEGEYEVVLDSSSTNYGGANTYTKYITTNTKNHGFDQSVILELSGNTALFLKVIPGSKGQIINTKIEGAKND